MADWSSLISSASKSGGSSGGGGGMDKVSGIVGSVEGTAGLVQMIAGLIKKRQLQKNRPKLGVTAGETENTNLFKQAASATEMPGQRQFESKLGQATAEGIYDSGRSAISSLGATQSAIDLTGKKIQAIQDLAGQFAEFKQQRLNALANWNQQRIELEQQRFKVNTFDPWMQQYGEAVGNYQNGFNTFIQGGERIAGAVGSGQGGQSQGYGGGVQQTMSSPLSTNYSPQNNLNNTLSGYRGQIK
jgi:hypothetical protein